MAAGDDKKKAQAPAAHGPGASSGVSGAVIRSHPDLNKGLSAIVPPGNTRNKRKSLEASGFGKNLTKNASLHKPGPKASIGHAAPTEGAVAPGSTESFTAKTSPHKELSSKDPVVHIAPTEGAVAPGSTESLTKKASPHKELSSKDPVVHIAPTEGADRESVNLGASKDSIEGKATVPILVTYFEGIGKAPKQPIDKHGPHEEDLAQPGHADDSQVTGGSGDTKKSKMQIAIDLFKQFPGEIHYRSLRNLTRELELFVDNMHSNTPLIFCRKAHDRTIKQIELFTDEMSNSWKAKGLPGSISDAAKNKETSQWTKDAFNGINKIIDGMQRQVRVIRDLPVEPRSAFRDALTIFSSKISAAFHTFLSRFGDKTHKEHHKNVAKDKKAIVMVLSDRNLEDRNALRSSEERFDKASAAIKTMRDLSSNINKPYTAPPTPLAHDPESPRLLLEAPPSSVTLRRGSVTQAQSAKEQTGPARRGSV